MLQFMTTVTNQHQLNERLRDYARSTRVVQVRPLKNVVVTAIESNFPGLLDKYGSLEDALEALGIVVIEDIGQGFDPKRISWSIATQQDAVDEQMTRYTQPEYRQLRRMLGIDYHWIFFVPKGNLWLYTDEQLIEGIGTFRDAGRPDCWVLDEFR
jgi:hypothetical protein